MPLPAIRKRHDLANARRLLLLLECHDLLAAVPPLLFRQLERLGLDLLDGEGRRVDALRGQVLLDEDVLPLVAGALEEVSAGFEGLASTLVSLCSPGGR